MTPSEHDGLQADALQEFILIVRTALGKPLMRELGACAMRFVLEAELSSAGIARRRGIPPQEAGTRFSEFWSLYPSNRRVDRAGTFRKWVQRHLEAEAQVIIDHITRMRVTTDWTKEGGMYVPMTATYINQRRWESHAEEVSLFAGGL